MSISYPVWVDAKDWRLTRNGNSEAKARLRSKLDQLVIYDHVFVPDTGEIPVSMDELMGHGVIEAVRLYRNIPAD